MTTPWTGRRPSDTDLVDSTSPKVSPAELAPTSGMRTTSPGIGLGVIGDTDADRLDPDHSWSGGSKSSGTFMGRATRRHPPSHSAPSIWRMRRFLDECGLRRGVTLDPQVGGSYRGSGSTSAPTRCEFAP